MRRILGAIMSLVQPGRKISARTSLLLLILVGIVALAAGGGATPEPPAAAEGAAAQPYFGLLKPILEFPMAERYALFAVLGVAVLGLLYAGMLVKQVLRADQGTPRMQEIARAVREGANAYLAAQFRKIGPLIILITVALFCHEDGASGHLPSAVPGPSWPAPCLAGRWASWACGWRPTATSASPPPPSAATARPCNWATAPAPSPAC